MKKLIVLLLLVIGITASADNSSSVADHKNSQLHNDWAVDLKWIPPEFKQAKSNKQLVARFICPVPPDYPPGSVCTYVHNFGCFCSIPPPGM
jgi:hypothetical protein